MPAANLDGASLPNYSEEDLAKKEYLERELDRILIDIDRVREKRDSYGPDAQPSNLPKWLQRISGVGAVIGCITRISRLIST